MAFETNQPFLNLTMPTLKKINCLWSTSNMRDFAYHFIEVNRQCSGPCQSLHQKFFPVWILGLDTLGRYQGLALGSTPSHWMYLNNNIIQGVLNKTTFSEFCKTTKVWTHFYRYHKTPDVNLMYMFESTNLWLFSSYYFWLIHKI